MITALGSPALSSGSTAAADGAGVPAGVGGRSEGGGVRAGAAGIAEIVGVSCRTGVGCGIEGIVADDVEIGVRCAGGSDVSGGREADVTVRGVEPVGIARGGVVMSSVGAEDV